MEKSFGSKSECNREAKKLINTKKDKGYSESDDDDDDESEEDSEEESEESSPSPPPKKRRKVSKKKKKKQIFDEYQFVISGNLKNWKQKGIEKLIKEYGGICKSKVTAKTDFVIVKQNNPNLKSTKCRNAERLNIPIISENYLSDCFDKNKRLNDKKYIIEEQDESSSSSSSDDDDESSSSSDNDDKGSNKKKSYKKLKMTGSAPVDEHFNGGSNWSVFEENGVVYDAMLNQTNIGQNNNKFYKLQILTNGDDDYIAYFRWARVGYKGQTSQVKGNKNKCIEAFKTKFYDKTLNNWEDRDDFESHARKYTYLPMDYGDSNNDDNDDDDDDDDDDKKNNSTIKSNLHKDIQDLVKLIFDKDMMEQQMREIGYDAAKLPLGKVDKTIIREAYQILKDIEDELNAKLKPEKKKNKNKRASRSSSSASSRKVSSSAINELSSRYYTLIPHEFGFKLPDPINNEKLLNKEMKLIESLSEIEVASRLLSKNKNSKIEQHPIDKHFDLLKCSMESISSSDSEFKILEKFVSLTHASTHNRYKLKVEKIFKLDRDGEDNKFNKFKNNSNRMLLWHGSRLTNFVGIISQGLRIAPPEAPVTGYMFGKGVYFADMCSKSANYCFTSPSNNTGLILLCEVALGDMNQLYYADYYASNLPQGKLSTKGCGKTSPDSSTYVKMDNGCIIPSGKGIKDNTLQTSLLYNEYIVYDTSQIKMKYLIKLNFDYGAGW